MANTLNKFKNLLTNILHGLSFFLNILHCNTNSHAALKREIYNSRLYTLCSALVV